MTRLLTPFSSTPRDVPGGVARRVRFGGPLGWAGWIAFGFGMIFVWTFALHADVSSWTQFGGPLQKAKGKVTAVRKTSATVGGGKRSKGTPIYEYDYAFETPDERSYTGTAYTTGSRFAAGAVATIEYPMGRPEVSRIQGTRRSMWPAGLVFIGLLGVPGPIMIFFALRKGRENVRLLREGMIAQGRLVSKKPTNTKVNNKTVYKFTFGFQDNRGKTHQVVTKTHDTSDIGDEATETIVYDPNEPARACVVDALPGKVKFDARGQIQPDGLGIGGWAFAGLVLGAHATVAVVMFGK